MRIPGDVVVERHDETHQELWVVSTLSVRRDELLTLDLSGPSRTFTVRVVESRPVLVDGSVRHRLRLAVVDSRPGGADAAQVNPERG